MTDYKELTNQAKIRVLEIARLTDNKLNLLGTGAGHGDMIDTNPFQMFTSEEKR